MSYQERVDKARKVITKCKTPEQLDIAMKWMNMLYEMHGIFKLSDFYEMSYLEGVIRERVNPIKKKGLQR